MEKSVMSITVFLRDSNKKVTDAWSKEFNGYKDVKVSCGDIFDINAFSPVGCDAIISPANSFGFMDGGIDLIYSEFFGRGLEKKLQEIICDEFFGELPVGLSCIVETKHDTIKYLISCPTMRVPEDVSCTVNAYLAFRAALIAVINFNNTSDTKIKSIVSPGLGTLTGRIPAEICAKQMRYAYDSIINQKISIPNDLREACILHYQMRNMASV
jgi:O-acetyl-ADP-ribose deacetylase (regulator of RNase III)